MPRKHNYSRQQNGKQNKKKKKKKKKTPNSTPSSIPHHIQQQTTANNNKTIYKAQNQSIIANTIGFIHLANSFDNKTNWQKKRKKKKMQQEKHKSGKNHNTLLRDKPTEKWTQWVECVSEVWCWGGPRAWSLLSSCYCCSLLFCLVERSSRHNK